MGVWIGSGKGQQELVLGQLSFCDRIGGLRSRLQRSPAQLNSERPRLGNKQSARCTFAAKPARGRGHVAADGPSSDGRRQELLWRQFFRDPTLWWDSRQDKQSDSWPDFRHRESQEVLWLNSFSKPGWVDAQLAALDVEVPGDPGPRRPAGYEVGVTAASVTELCGEGDLAGAVEALGILVQAGYPVAKSLFYAVLKKCVARRNLVLGRHVHALMVRRGYQSDTFLCNHILRMYASHGTLQDAMDVFTMVAEPDAFMWSSIISAHVKYGQDKQAVELYQRMRRSSVKPDGHVFVAALQACARGSDLKAGQQVHADVLASGAQLDLFVSSCLVDMYAKCGSLEDAQKVFDGLGEKDVVTWTALIAGYSQQGRGQDALSLYRAMQEEGIAVPNAVTFLCLLQACASVGTPALEMGRQLHTQVRERGHQADAFVGSGLVNMYAKCGSLEDAQRVFDGLVQKDVVTWNVMIAGYSQQGMGQEALGVYSCMQEEGIAVPDSVTFVCVLQACASVGNPALKMGKQLHVQLRERGHQADVFVANSLVNMYAKCGSLGDAQRVFDGLGQKDVVTWTALIAGYSQQGMGQEALHLYCVMQQEGIAVPNPVTFVCLLQACASVGTSALEMGKQLHGQIAEGGHEDVFVANSLVNMYAKCGSLDDAQRLFDGLGQKDVVTWTAMIAGYSQQGMGQEALHLYTAVQEERINATNSMTFVCLLQACASMGTLALEKGRELHTEIRERGFQADVFVGSSLVNMYAKCGSLEEAQTVFDGLGQKDVVTWNAMISGYSQQGLGQEALLLYGGMQAEGITSPNCVTFVCLLQACASVGSPALEMGKQMHAQIKERGHQDGMFVASSLVNMYAKCGSLEEAHRLFDELAQKDIVTWNVMIAGYSQQGMGQEALHLYSIMQEESMAVPNSVTFVCLLQACASVGTRALEKGKRLHSEIREGGHEADVFVANSLVNMYAKCGSLGSAHKVFAGLSKRDVATWNAMIAGYSQQGMGQEALSLYSSMQEHGIAVPDSVTFVCLLQACASMGTSALEKGRQLHSQIRQQGHQADVFVASSLVNMYAKCGSLEDAQRVFDGLGEKNVVTWNAMIAGYSKQGMGQEALRMYSAMQEQGTTVSNAVTFVCLLQACANVAALHLGRHLHSQIVEQGLQADVFVGGSLINMYGKCGNMSEAQQVFDALSKPDVIAWSALIAGYSSQGDSEVVFDLVQRMWYNGVLPVGITFLSVLAVCSHAGLVNKGREYFDAMTREYGINPTVEHYTCMVDLLGRTGLLDEALALVSTMPVLPSAALWHTLLGACQKWSNVEVGRHAFDEAVKLDNKDPAAYVLMANIYTGAQMWEQAREMQAMRRRIRARKQAGQSWWADVDGVVHSFSVADRRIVINNDVIIQQTLQSVIVQRDHSSV